MQAQTHLATRPGSRHPGVSHWETGKGGPRRWCSRRVPVRPGRFWSRPGWLRGQARPDRVERLEPVEEIGILGGRDGAGQGLVEVVMGVDQPGQDDVALKVEDLISGIGQDRTSGRPFR